MSAAWPIRLILLFVAMLAIGSPGRGEAAVPVASCIASATPGETAAAVLGDPRRFDCSTDQYRHGAGDYWALSAPVPAAAGDLRRVRLTSLWQEALTLHAIYADGRMATLPSTSATLSRRIQPGAIVEFALPRREAPLVRLLWRIDGSANARGVLLGQHLVTGPEAIRSNVQMTALFAGFVGLAVALLIYNLALWGAMRLPFQGAYCAMVAALILYAVSSSGGLAWIVPGIDNNDRLRINYTALGLTAAAAVAFARAFFEPRVFAGWLGPASRIAVIALAASGILFALVSTVDMPLGDRLYRWSFVAGLSITAPILWRVWATRSDYRWLFAIAWAVPIVFAVVRTLALLHLVPTSFWLDNSTVLSMALEALLSSLAIAYRVQMLSRERDAARAGEQIARRLADTDPLTGLLNRRAFLDRAIGRSGLQCLHLIDIDRFKAVNETLGHDGGDEVLRVFARTLRALADEHAIVARIGGEEFAVVAAPEHRIEPERILTRLRAARMPFDLTVTASVGSCQGPLADERDWKRLYHSADRALFEAKAAGRDRARAAAPLARAA